MIGTPPPMYDVPKVSPASHLPGVLVRQTLTREETPLFETKPHWMAMLLIPICLVIVSIILLSIFLIYPDLLGSQLTSMIILIMILVVIGMIILLIIRYLQWKNTAYAATNRRIITQFGGITLSRNNYHDCPHDKIQNVAVVKSLGGGTIVFATAGYSGGSLEPLKWIGVRDHVNTRRHVDEIIEEGKRRVEQEKFQRTISTMGMQAVATQQLAAQGMAAQQLAAQAMTNQSMLQMVQQPQNIPTQQASAPNQGPVSPQSQQPISPPYGYIPPPTQPQQVPMQPVQPPPMTGQSSVPQPPPPPSQTHASPQNTKFCIKCGYQMPVEAMFCPKCGTKT